MESAVEIRRFESPDDILYMNDAGGISIIKMRDGTTGMRATFEPEWTWGKDEKPLFGSPASCPMRHTGYRVAGKLVVRMADTQEENLHQQRRLLRDSARA